MKTKTAEILAKSLVAAFAVSVIVAPQATARNIPTAPIVSSNSFIDGTGTFEPWDGSVDGSGAPLYPTFDLEDEDLEVNVIENSSSAIVMVNIDLPNGFDIESFDAEDTYIEAFNDTRCTTSGGDSTDGDGEIDYGWDLSESNSTITAKGFSCYDVDSSDGYLIEFRFDVDDIYGYVTTTSAGSYDLESQFRTVENRRSKTTAWVTESEGALVLEFPVE